MAVLPPDLKLGVTLPGESLVIAILEAVTANRQTMSQANRDKFDAMFIASIERGDKIWTLMTGPLLRAIEKLGEP